MGERSLPGPPTSSLPLAMHLPGPLSPVHLLGSVGPLGLPWLHFLVWLKGLVLEGVILWVSLSPMKGDS